MTSPTGTPTTPIARALISVSDKTGLVGLARALAASGVEILASGGTAAALEAEGLAITEVSRYTGYPEAFDGRVKTLHPKIHGGILARRDLESHRIRMDELGTPPIDLVVVNLYPFEATIARGVDAETAIENIDIGGPSLIRGAAKNHDHVVVIVDPSDYDALLGEIAATGGGTRLGFRRALAAKAYARTAAYDAAIARWFATEIGEASPAYVSFAGTLRQTLRYGENPHQGAAFYTDGSGRPGVATARQVQGKELSYNNINDTDAAYELVAEFDPATEAAVAIIKHANPCGVALGVDPIEAYQRALACDPVSAFGGIVALNRRLEASAAREIVKIFTEVIIAPDADEEAIAIVAEKKNLRLLLAGGLPDPAARTRTVRSVSGGLLVQDRDFGRIGTDDLKIVTKRAPNARELADLLVAFRVAKHVKSNAIVYVRDRATVGVGAGQMSRVDAARIAAQKARDAAAAAGAAEPATIGSAVASDAFFPFADGLRQAVEAGATAVIQPGGSVRDAEVIAAADEAGLAMVFTGMRHFRH